MSKLPAAFLRILGAASEAGPQVTQAELRDALARARAGEAEIFAAQAIEAIGDGELARLLAAKIGASRVRRPIASLRDAPAAEAWLDGAFEIREGDRSPRNREAVRALQQALVRVGAHHPGGLQVPALLQLPYAADGDLGGATLTAINAMLELAGETSQVQRGEPLGRMVAENLEGLLEETPALRFPDDLTPAPAEPTRRAKVLFIGMGDASRHEADRVARLLPRRSDMIFSGDSKLGDDVLRAGDEVYRLAEASERRRFVDGAFAGGLDEAARAELLTALGTGLYEGADVRDEVGAAALALHEAQRPGGSHAVAQVYFSGHSVSRGLWGDSNGYLRVEAIAALCRAFPRACAGVRAVFLSACNHLHKRNVEEVLTWFPALAVCGGYSDLAPGTWTGAIRHCEAWARMVAARPEGPITAEELASRLAAWGGLAARHRFHLATWSRATGLYTTYEEVAGGWDYRVESLRGDPARAAALEQELRAEAPAFAALVAGTHPTLELRLISPEQDTPARRTYLRAVALAGEPAATPAQRAYAEALRPRALAARSYARVLEQFTRTPTIAGLIVSANRELAGLGVRTRSGYELASAELSRAEMLAYIAALEQARVRHPLTASTALYVEQLAQMIGRLEGVPEVWM
jgi:hypothetical protein